MSRIVFLIIEVYVGHFVRNIKVEVTMLICLSTSSSVTSVFVVAMLSAMSDNVGVRCIVCHLIKVRLINHLADLD